MAKQSDDDFFELLRARGLRKKLAKSIAALEGNSQRRGAKGEKIARQAVDDLGRAADDIRDRVLRSDPRRTAAAKKAARTRARNAGRRASTAKRGAQTRAKVARTRANAKTGSRS